MSEVKTPLGYVSTGSSSFLRVLGAYRIGLDCRGRDTGLVRSGLNGPRG